MGCGKGEEGAFLPNRGRRRPTLQKARAINVCYGSMSEKRDVSRTPNTSSERKRKMFAVERPSLLPRQTPGATLRKLYGVTCYGSPTPTIPFAVIARRGSRRIARYDPLRRYVPQRCV